MWIMCVLIVSLRLSVHGQAFPHRQLNMDANGQ